MALLDFSTFPRADARRNEPRVAIVSDPLVQRGGAERCVEVMAQTFPDAPIFALLYSSITGPASLEPRKPTPAAFIPSRVCLSGPTGWK